MNDPRNAHLLTLADQVDVLDLAGSIIADPRATRVPLAGELALAHAVERFWAVCIEAELLARALVLPDDASTRGMTILAQAQEVRRMMAELRGPSAPLSDDANTTIQETNNEHE